MQFPGAGRALSSAAMWRLRSVFRPLHSRSNNLDLMTIGLKAIPPPSSSRTSSADAGATGCLVVERQDHPEFAKLAALDDLCHCGGLGVERVRVATIRCFPARSAAVTPSHVRPFDIFAIGQRRRLRAIRRRDVLVDPRIRHSDRQSPTRRSIAAA